MSYTSNFSDPGTNILNKNHFGQTQIDLVNQHTRFMNLSEALNVYDAYSEIFPEKLKKLNPNLAKYDFDVDLYGKKDNFRKEFVLSCKNSKNPILSFEKSMKPHELNVILNIGGEDIFLVHSKDVLFTPSSINDLLYNENAEELIKEFSYYFTNIFQSGLWKKFFIYKIKRKMKILGTKKK